MSSTRDADIPDTKRLRRMLEPIAARGETRTYQEVAAGIGLEPPRTIQRLARALEALMDEDAAAGRPFLAAIVVSRSGDGLPAPGFFDHARKLTGDDAGPGTGDSAARWHENQRAALRHRLSSSSGGQDEPG